MQKPLHRDDQNSFQNNTSVPPLAPILWQKHSRYKWHNNKSMCNSLEDVWFMVASITRKYFSHAA